jgi:hypothetical protein
MCCAIRARRTDIQLHMSARLIAVTPRTKEIPPPPPD